MSENLRSILFAAAMGVASAALLTGANVMLRDYQHRNEEAERWRNVLDVLGVAYDAGASSEQLVRLAQEKVRERKVAGLVVYEYDHPAEGRLRAFEFSGQGLWGPIYGLLCLRADLATIYSISFYKQEETPGLGGEIQSPAFRGRFPGKRIVGEAGGPGLRVVRGEAAGPNEVRGISGATLTGEKVQAMLNRISEEIIQKRDIILREDGHGQ